MKLKRREKIMLEILIPLAIFALVFVIVLTPAIEEKIFLNAEREEVSQDLSYKENLMANTTLDEKYTTELKLAKKNYNYFYSVLNSYTIDTIINSLIKENHLFVDALTIGEYEDATYDFPKLSEEELKVLVKSTVNLTVEGSYKNILNFMNDLNKKSTGLHIDLISIDKNEFDVTGKKDMRALLRIYIYGVDVNIKGLQEELGIQSN